MFSFNLEGFSQTVSFRIPESHTFQQTLPLPPVTTLTGLMGAAMGLSFEEAMAYKKQKEVFFGVRGTSKGEIKDLWKYNKIKTNEVLKDVLIREYLTDFLLNFAIASKNRIALSQIRDSFLNPKFVLSLGNSDDLLKVTHISHITQAEKVECSTFENTILAGDQTLDYESAIDLNDTPITYRVRAPQVFLLPTSFKFIGEKRSVDKKEQFTFVGSPIKLKKPLFVYKTSKDKAFFLL